MSDYGRIVAGVAFVNASSEWRLADIGGVQQALNTHKTQAVVSGEGEGGGALAVAGDQLGNVTLIEAVVQAPRTLRARSRAHRLARDTVWQSRKSAPCAECE